MIVAVAGFLCCTAVFANFELHSADSGEQVRRDWVPQDQCHQVGPDAGLAIEMVKNEHEAVQLIVLAPNVQVSNVTWSVGPLTQGPGRATLPTPDVVLTPIGYVAGGPCPFDALAPSASGKVCPPDKPLRCVLGDAKNDTSRCVASGADSIHCVGCSASPGIVSFRPDAYG